jgi:hypothetical protein
VHLCDEFNSSLCYHRGLRAMRVLDCCRVVGGWELRTRRCLHKDQFTKTMSWLEDVINEIKIRRSPGCAFPGTSGHVSEGQGSLIFKHEALR